MSIQRLAHKHLLVMAKTFRSVAVIGPRQSGKTTLCKMAFPKKPYISLENPTNLQYAKQDPEGFLKQFKNGAIIDEVQRMPELFSYLQQILDETKKQGLFILTGSNNFLVQENITQTLAGRIGYMNLLPFTFSEIEEAKKLYTNWHKNAYIGSYPEVIVKKLKPSIWYAAYVKTYIERDVRQIKNIDNLILFLKFVQLCAGRCGQIINVNNLANDCGIDNKTAQSWLSVLESSFIIFFLKPHGNNFNKQIIKSPKLYFYDTGLLCNLLNIPDDKAILTSSFKGTLFENYIIAEKQKQIYHLAKPEKLFYWRDKTGNEIDLIEDNGKKILITEIKAGETIQPDFWKTLLYYEKLSGKLLDKRVIYGGNTVQQRSNRLNIIGWRDIEK
jgi:uncharacterized protein